VNDTVKNSQRDGAVNEGGADVALSTATDQCTSLGLVLIRHANHHSNNIKSRQLYAKLTSWYANLQIDARQMACNLFRAHLQKEAPEYPSSQQSSTVIAEAFSSSSAKQQQQQQQQQSWSVVAKCLVELQIIHDAVQMVQSQPIDDNKHLLPQWRFDIVDELLTFPRQPPFKSRLLFPLFSPILWMQLKFDVNFCNSQRTPYDAVNDAQHLYHH